ncbi:Ig-like domain-containing protein [Rhodococcus xishaensis]|uniref:Ig-like domain repeat protein n=1 Tax=Rhodococcus xishaensis TaxID=2487364 RepID=A0A3S3DYZ2_9NOCA|nr:Ig-like domain-containing protein [Rhodococcus xishaensis]RVW02086.1 Ig-like domain repeat protein [Rhodococcus xishaensis]
MIAVLLGAGVGTAAASEPPPSSNTYNEDQLGVTKEVVGSNVVHPGDVVTYKTTVRHRNNGIRLSISEIRDIPPAGFELIRNSVKVTYVNWTDKYNIAYNSDGGMTVTCKDRCTFLVGGFDLVDGETVVVEASYRVPANAQFGDYDSGTLVGVRTWGDPHRGGNPFGVFVRVEDPNVNTTTTLDAPAAAKTGEPATLTATLDPSNADGRVQFKDGGADIGSPVDVVGGVATLSHTFDTVGAHEITANFLADSGFYDSTSAPATVDVTADTSTALQVPATALVGEDVTATASITPDTATGRVQFKVDGENYGQPVAVVDGAASLTRSFPEALSHSITAEFAGTGGYLNSVSSPAEITVNDPDWGTTTTVVEPVTAVTGTPVNLSATVLPIPSGGDVRFLVDGVEVGTAPVGTADGVAVLPHTFEVAGTANVVAEFTGTAGFEPSASAGFTVTVTDPEPARTETRTLLEVSGKTAVGQQVTFTATVDPGTADGTVEFRSGTTVLGTAEVVDGVATLTHSFDVVGTHAVTASFVGGPDFADSVSGPTVLTVGEDSGPGPLGSLEGLFG